jgi:transcriptional regulator with XRE-family HTH domain
VRFDGAEVKCRREARGMTQRELGAAAGVNATAICRLERGNRTPLAITCALIARELGIPMETILHD